MEKEQENIEQIEEKQTEIKQEEISLEERLKRINELANQPFKCSIDEVASAYFASLRVENYEVLGETFGGYKIGRLYLHILDLLSKEIYNSIHLREISRNFMTRENSPICSKNKEEK